MNNRNIRNKSTSSGKMTTTITPASLLVVLTLALSGWSLLLAQSASLAPTTTLVPTTTTTTTTTATAMSDEPEITTFGLETIMAKSISDSYDSTHNKLSVSKASEESTTTEDISSSSDETETPPTVRQERPTVNLTENERIYIHGRRDEKDVVEFFRSLEKRMKQGIGAAVGAIVPVALNKTNQIRVNSNCMGSILHWTLGMTHLKSWALKMLDAAGKPSAGLFEGAMTMFGNYRQCTKIRVADEDEIEFTGKFQEYFRGKYCIIQAKPWLPEKKRFYNLNAKIKGLNEKTGDDDEESDSAHKWYEKTLLEEFSDWTLAFNFINIRFDVCVPSLCSREDLQSIINLITSSIDVKARVLRCEMDAPDNGNASYISAGVSIESDQAELLAVTLSMKTSANSSNDDSPQSAWFFMQRIGWALVVIFIIVLVLLATACSVISETKDKKRNHYVQRNEIIMDRFSGGDGSKLGHAIKSISLKRSADCHLEIDYDQLADDKPLAIYGLRFIFVLWIMATEFAFLLKFEYLRELLMLKDLIFWWPLQFIINSTLQFDSLILITAFTMAYKNCLNEGVGCQPKAIRKYVLDKYIRLVPSLLLVVAMTILVPFLYRGPVWNDFVAKQASVCLTNGWLNAFLLQNNLPFSEICLPNTWLLALEFQLVLLMAPVVYYLNKNYLHNLGGKLTGDNPSASNIADIDIVGDYKKAASNLHELSFVNGGHRGASASPAPRQTANHHRTRSNNTGDDCAANQPFYWLRTSPGLVLVGCIVFGSTASFYNVYSNELPPSWLYTMADPDGRAIYFNGHLMRLFTHLAVFSMGILAGLECRRAVRLAKANDTSRRATSTAALNGASPNGNTTTSTSTTASTNTIAYPLTADRWACTGAKSRRSIILDTIGSVAVITIMSAILFSTYDWSVGDLPGPLVAGLYDISSRFFWSLGLIWILYKVSVPSELVANDDGSSSLKFSLMARTLGRPGMVSLGKLSFLIYILHPFVHTTVLAIQEQPIYSSWFMLFHVLLGNFALTTILAFLVSVFVEMPFRNLFVRRCGSSLFLAHATVGDRTSASSAAPNTAPAAPTAPTVPTVPTAPGRGGP